MPLETATFINQLDPSNPVGFDPVTNADDHMRLIKSTIRNTFPNLTGAVSATEADLGNPILKTTAAAMRMPYFTSTSAATTTALGSTGLSLLGATSPATVISLLGLDTRYQMAGQQSTNLSIAGSASVGSTLTVGSNATIGGRLVITSGEPTVSFVDVNHRSGFINVNGNYFVVARGGYGATQWDPGVGSSGHPMNLSLETGTVQFAGSVLQSSDRRVKTDIATIPDALSKIFGVTGITYSHVTTGERSTGVIAQDVEAVLPEAVVTNAAGFKSVAYGNIVGLLIEGIKELANRVDALEAVRT